MGKMYIYMYQEMNGRAHDISEAAIDRRHRQSGCRDVAKCSRVMLHHSSIRRKAPAAIQTGNHKFGRICKHKH